MGYGGVLGLCMVVMGVRSVVCGWSPGGVGVGGGIVDELVVVLL